MIKNKLTVCFVCMANYCRSPVAEALLKNKYEDSLNVDSAGISPMITAGMDPRSIDFLNKKNIRSVLHTPKKINKALFESSNIVFAMDTFILMELNSLFKKYKNKIKLFSFQHKNINIYDPYHLSKEDYKNVMENISQVIDGLNFDSLYK